MLTSCFMGRPFSIEVQEKEGCGILVFSGDVTGDSESEIRARFNELDQKTQKKLILDLADTDYINSAGIANLISLLNRVKELKGEMALTAMNEHFSKVLNTVGLTDFITVKDTPEEAVTHFNS